MIACASRDSDNRKSPIENRKFPLRNQKDFLCVRIFHFRAGSETFHVNILAGRVRALDQVRLVWHRNAVGIIALGNPGRSSRLWRAGVVRSASVGLCRTIRVKRLLLRRILTLRRLARGCRSSARVRWRWFIHVARGEDPRANQQSRQREFHKASRTRLPRFSFIAKAKAPNPSQTGSFRKRRLVGIPSKGGSCQFHTVNDQAAFELEVKNGATYG